MLLREINLSFGLDYEQDLKSGLRAAVKFLDRLRHIFGGYGIDDLTTVGSNKVVASLATDKFS